jgi:hypothetical protein
MYLRRLAFGRVTWWALALALVATALAIAAPVSGAALDDEATSAAGFIVDTGEGEPLYVVVTFAEPSMTAIELLRSADLDAVTVEFGGLGEAVCSIVETGCDVGACRQRVCQSGDPESPFWQYWEQDEAGAWALSPLGASHAELGDQEIAAWVWTGAPPELEPVRWADLAVRAGAPDAIAHGEVFGAPAVYVSGRPPSGGAEGTLTGTLTSIGAIALIGLAGLLVARWRRHAGTVA